MVMLPHHTRKSYSLLHTFWVLSFDIIIYSYEILTLVYQILFQPKLEKISC